MVETQLSALPAVQSSALPHVALDAIAMRERVTDHYWARRDPINELRIGWRAQTVRHMFHLLPGERPRAGVWFWKIDTGVGASHSR